MVKIILEGNNNGGCTSLGRSCILGRGYKLISQHWLMLYKYCEKQSLLFCKQDGKAACLFSNLLGCWRLFKALQLLPHSLLLSQDLACSYLNFCLGIWLIDLQMWRIMFDSIIHWDIDWLIWVFRDPWLQNKGKGFFNPQSSTPNFGNKNPK